jgi:hypothetical protein
MSPSKLRLEMPNPRLEHVELSALKNAIARIPRRWWGFAGVIAVLAVLTVACFAHVPHPVFMGDDLNQIVGAHTGGYASSLQKALTSEKGALKYRPVFATILYLETLAFGDSFYSYVCLNILLEFLNACLVAMICYRLSRKNLMAALFCGVMFIISRFSYYQVHQMVGGALEGTALLLFLLTVFGIVYAYESRKPLVLAWPLLFYFVLIFTHERYTVVAPALAVAILLAPTGFRRRWHRYAMAAVPPLFLTFNYALKVFILHMPFFQGTENELTFESQPILKFLLSGASNMLGFNVGPNMFSGLDLANAGARGYILGGVFTMAVVTLGAAYVHHRLQTKRKTTASDIWGVLLFLLLFVALIAAASVATRQEFRWLYAPYAVVIFGIAYLFGRISSHTMLRLLLLAGILFSAIAVDTFYRSYRDNVFFYDGMKIADSAERNIVDKYGSDLSGEQLFIVGADSMTANYYLMGAKLITFYSGDGEIDLHYLDSMDGIINYEGDPNDVLVFWFDPEKREFADITEEARAAMVTCHR